MLYSWLLNRCALPLVGLCTDSSFFSQYRRAVARPHAVYAPDPSHQLRRLVGLLQHAYDTVPFYRDRMDGCGFKPANVRHVSELGALAVLRKADIAANFPDRIVSSARQFTPWRYRGTSGTIERLTVVHDTRKRDAVRALQLFSLHATSGYSPGMKYLELPPDVCRQVCGAGTTVDPPVWRYVADNLRPFRLSQPDVVSDLKGLVERNWVYRQTVLTSFQALGLNRTSEVDECLRQIWTFRPDVVKALPAYLYLLAVHILERGLEPPPVGRCLLPMGSSLAPIMKERIEAAFRCRVIEDYGSSELGAIAAECGHQNGLHPFSEFFHVEVLDGDRPAAPGQLGRIVITDLSNYAMPFIRYEIGDVGLFHDTPCPCGAPGPRLEVQGRLQDCLQSADGTLVSEDRAVDALLGDPDVFLFQLETRPGGLQLRVVPQNGRTINTLALERRVTSLLGRESPIKIHVVSQILPEPGGKYRFVRNAGRAVAGGAP